MKKKIVISEKVTAVMLAAAMAISMTACGSLQKICREQQIQQRMKKQVR